MKLPTTLRPSRSSYKECRRGIDLPSWFFDDLKSIDEKLYIVWHPFKLIWDDVMNQYEGLIEDPRFPIHREHGEEVWGFIERNPDKSPIREGAWHVWRLCDPYGWCHVVRVESKHGEYLRLLTRRLHLQARFRDRYGDIAWNRHMRDSIETAQIEKQAAQHELFNAVQQENSWLTQKAMDNMRSGKMAPTNPTIEKVVSYPGQTNHTATSRPLDDSDVGLKGIEDL